MRNWLIAIRKDAGLTQKHVSTEAGIAQSSYCNIENENRGVAVQTAKAIADVLKFDWTNFMKEIRNGKTNA